MSTSRDVVFGFDFDQTGEVDEPANFDHSSPLLLRCSTTYSKAIRQANGRWYNGFYGFEK